MLQLVVQLYYISLKVQHHPVVLIQEEHEVWVHDSSHHLPEIDATTYAVGEIVTARYGEGGNEGKHINISTQGKKIMEV